MSSRSTPERYRLFDDLKKLGFSGHESRVYVALLKKSPATAYEISKLAGLPHANVYRCLETLLQKGAAHPVTQRPARYAPVNPETLLREIAQRTATLCSDLANRLAQDDRTDDVEHVWLVRGEENMQVKVDEMISGAREHLWIKAHELTLARHLPAMKKAARRGVKMLIIFLGNPDSSGHFVLSRKTKVYCHEGTGHSGTGTARHSLTMTADLTSALTIDTRDGGYGAFTRSPPVVHLANTMIRHEVYLAEMFLTFGSQIEAIYGPALINIRKHYLARQDIQKLRKELG